jgi:tetratricopeptide (TPR) repeat protein
VPSCWMQTTFLKLTLCCSLALLYAAPAAAQEPIPLDSLLFEPHPIPAGSALDVRLDAVQLEHRSTIDTQAGSYLIPDDLEATAERSIERYLENISAVEADDGPFAPALLEQYLSLGKAYQQNNEHTEAIEVLEKAEYISRINSGLFAAEQFVIVENLIGSYLATGETRKAFDRQQYLLFLNQQNFGEDSLQAVPVLRKLADWQMDSFSSAINAETPFTISINSGGRGPRNATPREFAFSSLYLAQNTYFQAIRNLVNNNQLANPALPELELKLIEAVFLSANRRGLLSDPDFYMDPRLVQTGSRIMRRNLAGNSVSFVNGRNAYLRMRIYEEHQATVNPLEVARTIIGLGDWHLLFDRRTNAVKYYEEAAAYLRSQNVAEVAISNLLHPELPPQLPLFTALPHSRQKYGMNTETMLPFAGYADVSFDLTRYGNVRNIEINSTTGEFSKNMERRLIRILRTTPFRPRMRDGKVITSDNIRIRYYYADVRTVLPATEPQL